MRNNYSIPKTFPVACHSDYVEPGGTFVAIKGMTMDGLDYIDAALRRGAKTIVVQEQTILSEALEQAIQHHQAQLERVRDPRQALAQLSADALGHPAQSLKIIGVTGTKGKTTTTFILEYLLKQLGYKTALLSSVKNRIRQHEFSTHLTTQHPDYLHIFFKMCIEQGVEWVVMEVAAQAATLYRVEGITFDALIFTNFSNEHAEFYSSPLDYFNAKKSLIKHLKASAPLILNADDTALKELESTHSFFFGLNQTTESRSLHITSLGNANQGLHFKISTGTTQYIGSSPALLGAFNLSNIAAATSCLYALDIPLEAANTFLTSFPGVPGRLNQYQLPNGARAIIDHAHNPSSFQAVLTTLRSLTTHLIVVFGAGGNRDTSKRPIMGTIAASYADFIVLTSDNPRSEDPSVIIQAIQKGIPEDKQHAVYIELDRSQAIHYAYAQSRANSIIALLGKGCEDYQVIGNTKIPFCEATIIKQLG